MTFRRVVRLDELWDGEMRGCAVGETAVVLINLGGAISAFVDRCAHQSVPMSQGQLKDGTLVCSAHQWIYDARSGCGINPASARLKALPVKIEQGAIWVDADEEELHG